MNVAMVERNCVDCLLRRLNASRGPETEAWGREPEPESAPERQLEQLERSFGPNWKW